MEMKYPHYIRFFEDGKYLKPYPIKEIDSIIQNLKFGKVSDMIILKSRERISGEIIQINAGEHIVFKHQLLKDTILIPDSLILDINHRKIILNQEIQNRYKGVYHYISFSPGVGLSYGGLGWRLQYRVGKEFGMGLHVGGGLTFDSFFGAGPRYNIGIKLFFLTYFYIDGSYGTIGTYYKKVYPYLAADEKAFSYDGYSVMAGTDYFFNRTFGINLAFGVKLPVEENFNKWKEAIDVGVIFKLSINHKRKKDD